MAHMDMEERGFAIGSLYADQLLRHMRIPLNQQIHFRISFEQAQYVFVVKQIGSRCCTKFLAVHFTIRAMCLLVFLSKTMFGLGVRQRPGFVIKCRLFIILPHYLTYLMILTILVNFHFIVTRVF